MNLNSKTKLLLGTIVTVFVIGLGLSIWGAFAPNLANANYIRQGAATRLFEGGGTSFGK